MRILFWIILSLGLGGWLAVAHADTYQLMDGTSVSGDLILFNEAGVTLRTPSDSYTNVVWPMFAQGTLRQLAQNPKIRPLAEPFIETPRPAKDTTVTLREVSRLQPPPEKSLFIALLSSSVGFVALLLLYAANVYAGYEIALLRARPIVLTMGVAAVLPVLGPIIFISLPVWQETEPAAETQPGEPQSFSVPGGAAPMAASVAAGGVHISPATGTSVPQPEAQIFQRGQFMFNRRFFETKFAGFFPTIRRPAEKDLVLVIKTARAQLTVQRITRIATNEAHFEVLQGGGRQEMMVPFADIQEIQLKHKDA